MVSQPPVLNYYASDCQYVGTDVDISMVCHELEIRKNR